MPSSKKKAKNNYRNDATLIIYRRRSTRKTNGEEAVQKYTSGYY